MSSGFILLLSVAMVTVAMIFQEAGDETFLLSRYLGLYHAIEQAEMFSSVLYVEWFYPIIVCCHSNCCYDFSGGWG